MSLSSFNAQHAARHFARHTILELFYFQQIVCCRRRFRNFGFNIFHHKLGSVSFQLLAQTVYAPVAAHFVVNLYRAWFHWLVARAVSQNSATFSLFQMSQAKSIPHLFFLQQYHTRRGSQVSSFVSKATSRSWQCLVGHQVIPRAQLKRHVLPEFAKRAGVRDRAIHSSIQMACSLFHCFPRFPVNCLSRKKAPAIVHVFSSFKYR